MSDLDIQRVKDAYHLESYIPGLKKAGRLYKMCCPFHAEKSPSFLVDAEKQQWRCYGACNEGGDVFTYAMKLNGWSFGDALKELAQRAGVKLDTRTRKDDAVNTRLLGLLKEIAYFYHDTLLNTEEGIEAMDYLTTRRGLNVADMEIWQLGYAPAAKDASYSHLKNLGYTEDEMIAAGVRGQDSDTKQTWDHFRHRIMFPIHDDKGRVRGFSARQLPGGAEPKYKNSPTSPLFDKSSLLYGLFQARSGLYATQAPDQVLTIVEGQMDAIRAHKRGFKNVCAQMGISLTDKHLEMLKRYGVQAVILCLDNDDAGFKTAHERASKIIKDGTAFRLGLDIKIARLTTHKDPDELIRETPDSWPDLITSARPAVNVLIDYEVARLPPDATTAQKTELAKSLTTLLRVPDNALMTQDNARAMAVALNLPERLFVEWAGAQLTILPKLSGPTPAPVRIDPPLEIAVLAGMIINADTFWLMRANAALDTLTSQILPYALGPLSALDFTHDTYGHLFSEILASGAETIEERVSGTLLEGVCERVARKPLATSTFEADTPQSQPQDTYEQFLGKVFRLRMNRLKSDMEMFNLMDDSARFTECAKGFSLIQKRLSAAVR